MDNLEQKLHMQCYVDFMRYAAGDQETMTAFIEQTGIKFTPARSPIESMIDKATGADKTAFEAFANWCADQYGRAYLPRDPVGAIAAGPLALK
jgi:hypothetical protein